jgi:hypothetical protein
MKLNTLFIINTVVAFLFGLGFVLIPANVLSLYGIEMDATGLFVSRLLGSAFLGFGIITWMLRNSTGSAEIRSILLAYAVSDLIGFVLALVYQMQGIANALGWSTVAIYLLLGLGFGYLYMRQGKS